MPVKTVTILVQAATDKANAEIRATGQVFDELRRKSPVEMKVKLDAQQAVAESRVLARMMSQTIRDTVKLNADGAGGGGIIGRLIGVGGGAGGAGIPGAGLPGIGPAISAVGPVGLGAGAVAALAALPFLAQAAASGITVALGGALAGIGVYAEKGVRSVQYQFSQLVSGKQGISATLNNISPAFGQALTSILSAARTFIPQFIRMFGPALDAIAGPLKSLGVELAGSLASPQVADSLKAMGQAFGGILKALTPAIPGIVTAIADGFTNLARAVGKNPKAIADLAIGLAHLIGVGLDVLAWLTQVAAYIEQHFIPAFHRLGEFFVAWGHQTEEIFNAVRHVSDDVTHAVRAAWDATGTAMAAVAMSIERTFLRWNAALAGYINDVIGFFRALPHRTLQVLGGWGNSLNSVGREVINLLWEGLKAGAGGILGWIQHFASGVVGIFKKVWGWFSPSSVMYEGGKALMEGLAGGIKDHAHLAQNAATAAAGHVVPNVGSGVMRWKGIVLEALKMEGLGSYLASQVLYQMMTESGGNPNAINLTDINAQHGDPSRGLLQVIGSTFARYHWPGTSFNIYDPLANVAAAINYARNVYGPTLMSGGQGLGSGHGYAYGGLLTEPVFGVGASGSTYSFGERGPEWIGPGGGGGGWYLRQVVALLEEICDLLGDNNEITARAPAATGARLGAALASGARSATYKALYS